jgi:hypothetical protein
MIENHSQYLPSGIEPGSHAGNTPHHFPSRRPAGNVLPRADVMAAALMEGIHLVSTPQSRES